MNNLTQEQVSDEYCPVKSLGEEVSRFMETNTFNAMQVTNFYMQARCVINEIQLKNSKIQELEKENHQAARLLQSLRKKLEESELYRDVDGIINSSNFELIQELKQKLAESAPKSEIKRLLFSKQVRIGDSFLISVDKFKDILQEKN